MIASLTDLVLDLLAACFGAVSPTARSSKRVESWLSSPQAKGKKAGHLSALDAFHVQVKTQATRFPHSRFPKAQGFLAALPSVKYNVLVPATAGLCGMVALASLTVATPLTLTVAGVGAATWTRTALTKNKALARENKRLAASASKSHAPLNDARRREAVQAERDAAPTNLWESALLAWPSVVAEMGWTGPDLITHLHVAPAAAGRVAVLTFPTPSELTLAVGESANWSAVEEHLTAAFRGSISSHFQVTRKDLAAVEGLTVTLAPAGRSTQVEVRFGKARASTSERSEAAAGAERHSQRERIHRSFSTFRREGERESAEFRQWHYDTTRSERAAAGWRDAPPL